MSRVQIPSRPFIFMKSPSKKEIEKLAKNTYNKIALCYTKVFKKNPNYLIVLKKFVKDIPKGTKVLDAGCGTGVPVAKFLSKKLDVIGIDISSKMIQLARKNVQNAKFKKMSLTNINLKSNSFNLICCFFALFHVKKSEIPKVIKKFYSLLKKEGLLIISLGEAKKNKEEISTFFKERIYYAGMKQKNLERIIKKAGFKVIYTKLLNHEYEKLGRKFKDKEFFVVAKK